MNVSELRSKVVELKIKSSFFSILDSAPTEGLVISSVNGGWQVYFLDERGNMRQNVTFYREDEACSYFLNRLLKQIESFGDRMLDR